VKQVLLISLLFSFSLTAGTTNPSFECGLYQVQGKLRQNNQGHFLLVFNHGSTSPFELILIGGDKDKMITSLDTHIKAKIYVPNPIKTQHRPLVFLKAFTAGEIKSNINLLKKTSCKDKKHL
jgi:hypothetical protein